MKKIVIFLCILVIVLTFSNCLNKNNQPTTSIITDIEIDYENEIDISNSLTTNLFESCKLIKLETTSESLFSNIKRLIVFDNKYYILDQNTNSVYVFNEFGKFVLKIKHVGKGPGEYVQLTDFTIDINNKHIILLCDIPNCLIYFDLKGSFIKQEKKSVYNHYISANKDYMCFARFLIGNNIKYLSIENDDKNIELLPVDKYIVGKDFYGPHPNIIRSKYTFFFKVYDNIVYKLLRDRVVPAYCINFGEKALPKSYIEKNNLEKILMSCTDEILRINDFREYNDYLIFGTWPYNKIIIYYKKDEIGKVFSGFYDPETGLYLSNYIGHDGYGNDVIFIKSAKSFANNVLNIKNLEEVKRNETYLRFKKVASSVSENDNPILISYSLK